MITFKPKALLYKMDRLSKYITKSDMDILGVRASVLYNVAVGKTVSSLEKEI